MKKSNQPVPTEANLQNVDRYIPFSIRRFYERFLRHRHNSLVKDNNIPDQGHTPNRDHTEEAYHRIHLLSEGRLVLLSKYLGDSYVHPFHCHDCDSTFLASFEEIKDRLPDNGCSHCSDFKNRSRMYDAEKIEKQVTEISLQGTYFLKSNTFRQYIPSPYFHFYCRRHNISYECQYQQFLNTSPAANGCPICLQEHLIREGNIS